MLHTKRMQPHETSNWLSVCKGNGSKWDTCHVGISWAKDLRIPASGKTDERNEDGFIYNCFVNERIEDYWIPKLRKALNTLSS